MMRKRKNPQDLEAGVMNDFHPPVLSPPCEQNPPGEGGQRIVHPVVRPPY